MKCSRFANRLLVVSCFTAFASAQTPPAVAPELTIRGDVATTVVLKADDLLQMPRERVVIPDQDGTKVNYEGVSLREILKRAAVPLDKDLRGRALASYILARAHDGYQVVFSLGEIDAAFGNESIVVADKRDGKPLPAIRARSAWSARTTRSARVPSACWKPLRSFGCKNDPRGCGIELIVHAADPDSASSVRPEPHAAPTHPPPGSLRCCGWCHFGVT